jgi:2-polyprenyl-3-methyl-5-hydroxy-6-metoxy-1,4-benzoquinol methylase
MPETDQSQREFWNRWNAEARELVRGDMSLDQATTVEQWMGDRRDLKILDAGCGTGWLCERLVPFGTVVGTDLADDVVNRARERVPEATFVAGDIMSVDVGGDFDVIVSLEVLSHVADQPAFLSRLHSLLTVGGRLLIATQNRPVLERFNRIPPPGPGQLRRWVDRRELRGLLEGAGFVVDEMRLRTPKSDHGPMRVVAKTGRVLRCSGLLERLGFGWTIMARATRATP